MSYRVGDKSSGLTNVTLKGILLTKNKTFQDENENK